MIQSSNQARAHLNHPRHPIILLANTGEQTYETISQRGKKQEC
jgi:hypothetical protein